MPAILPPQLPLFWSLYTFYIETFNVLRVILDHSSKQVNFLHFKVTQKRNYMSSSLYSKPGLRLCCCCDMAIQIILSLINLKKKWLLHGYLFREFADFYGNCHNVTLSLSKHGWSMFLWTLINISTALKILFFFLSKAEQDLCISKNPNKTGNHL